jgi:hypothetical protein
VLQGEMEQLTISKDSSAVSNQCSATRIPITTDTSQTYEMQGDDPSVLPASTSKDRKSEGNYKIAFIFSILNLSQNIINVIALTYDNFFNFIFLSRQVKINRPL